MTGLAMHVEVEHVLGTIVAVAIFWAWLRHRLKDRRGKK